MKLRWKPSGTAITAFTIAVLIAACQKQAVEPDPRPENAADALFSKASSDTVIIEYFQGDFNYREGVVLEWYASLEENNTGFHVWRSLEESTNYELLTTALIPSMAGTEGYAGYAYIDTTCELGRRYFYKIEAVLSSGRSLFFDPIQIICSETRPVTPRETELIQNYPNPFNGTTTIRFSLQNNIFVDLAVYTPFHKKVCILISGQLSAGMHEVIFTVKNEKGDLLPRGPYLYTLKAGDYECTKTMYLGRE
jgi:hypothetical protein